MMKEALFYNIISDGIVQCTLCPHMCKLKRDQIGVCGVRQNIDDKLYSLVYGRAIAVHVDPIEKKPLFHVSPGCLSFSISTVGCNFKCKFCQNCEISQVDKNTDVAKMGTELQPDQIVTMAKSKGCQSIAYTYTEPTIYFEYAFDCSRLATDQKILNIFVTNGYTNPEPIRKISPYLDAANVDLKSFRDEFYKKLVGAKLTPVLDTLKLMKKENIWIEVTTLVIPTQNDSEQELRDIARFIKQELGEETPWHISRFYPQYKLTTAPPTSVAILNRAREIGLEEGLRYVYTGNVPGNAGEHTYCHQCGKMIIRRMGFEIYDNYIVDSKCQYCGTKIDGINLT